MLALMAYGFAGKKRKNLRRKHVSAVFPPHTRKHCVSHTLRLAAFLTLTTQNVVSVAFPTLSRIMHFKELDLLEFLAREYVAREYVAHEFVAPLSVAPCLQHCSVCTTTLVWQSLVTWHFNYSIYNLQ